MRIEQKPTPGWIKLTARFIASLLYLVFAILGIALGRWAWHFSDFISP